MNYLVNVKIILNSQLKKGVFFSEIIAICIFVPPQVLTCSGSKGMISACKGTPKDIGNKDSENLGILHTKY